jgi:hypothetical protein
MIPIVDFDTSPINLPPVAGLQITFCGSLSCDHPLGAFRWRQYSMRPHSFPRSRCRLPSITAPFV